MRQRDTGGQNLRPPSCWEVLGRGMASMGLSVFICSMGVGSGGGALAEAFPSLIFHTSAAQQNVLCVTME